MGPARTVASVAERLPRIGGSAQLGDERSRVERVEAEPARDLLARRLRSFVEQLAEQLAGLGVRWLPRQP